MACSEAKDGGLLVLWQLMECVLPKLQDPGFDFRLRCRDFSGSSHTSDLKTDTPVTPCQAPGVIGSALGLVDPVSAYCD